MNHCAVFTRSLRRATLLAAGSFLLLGGHALISVAQTTPASDNFQIMLAGDSIVERRLSVYDDPGYLQLINRIRGADVAFTNFENLVHDYESWESPSTGTYMRAPRFVLDELKWAGFRIFSLANNHSYDYEALGLLTSMHHFDDAGMIYAGVGENLARARAPGYFDTKKGRVALIACASTFPVYGPAGEQRADLKGRPGVSPLRVKTTYTVEPATLASLRQLSGGRGGGNVRLSGATFQAGDKPGITTEPDPNDMAGIIAGIRNARRMADWVVVSIHAHEGAPGDVEVPAQFLKPFAHAAIDAGADVFVGHGPHMLRGIEIYKGKPIFYSMGNFVMQDDLVAFQPQESFNTYKLPPTAEPSEFFDARWDANSFGFKGDQRYWQSVVAEPTFNSKRELQAIDLYPITLTYNETSPSQRGQPFPASAQDAAKIIDKLAKLSRPMGTKIVLQDGKGVVVLDPRSAP